MFLRILKNLLKLLKNEIENLKTWKLVFWQWVKKPCCVLLFIVLLVINSLITFIFLFFYFWFFVYWLYKLILFKNKTILILEIKQFDFSINSVFLYYILLESYFRARSFSFLSVYMVFKRICEGKTKTDISVLILNYIIKYITGFSRRIIYISFITSLKFKDFDDYKNYKEIIYYDVLPSLVYEYFNIENRKIYYEGGKIKFNFIKINNFHDLFRRIDNTVIDTQLKQTLICLKTYTTYLSQNTVMKNVKIDGINKEHLVIITNFCKNSNNQNNNQVLFSTLTKRDNIIKTNVGGMSLMSHYGVDNPYTGINSKITQPVLIKQNQLLPQPLKTFSHQSTRSFLLNSLDSRDIYSSSLLCLNQKNVLSFQYNKFILLDKTEQNVLIYCFKNKDKLNLNVSYEWLTFLNEFNYFQSNHLMGLNYNERLELHLLYLKTYHPETYSMVFKIYKEDNEQKHIFTISQHKNTPNDSFLN